MGLRVSFVDRVADGDLARGAGIDPDASAWRVSDVRRAVALRRAVVYRQDDVWFDEHIGDGWIAAYRLAVDDDGRPIISELRVFPDVWPGASGADKRPSGSWAGDYAGPGVNGVPRRGLSMTVLRRVKIGRPYRAALDDVEEMRKGFPGYEDVTALGHFPARATRGPQRLDDLTLAETAALHVAGKSRSEIAQHLGVEQSTVRGRMNLARKRGLLFPPKERMGSRNGASLTDTAKRLLASKAKRGPRGRGKGKR